MEFRALYPEEFETWLDHVAHVFSAGRQYFSNHWYNDPWRDVAGIRVAVDDGKIVSTVRVFIRKMFLHGEPISVGGIGEVSTRPEYRRQGIATQLLKDSIAFMEDREIAISLLHGSQRIYSGEGWQKVPRYYAKITLSAQKQTQWRICPINFENENEVEQLAALYDTYSRKFNGPFVRDNRAYWTDWVKTESPSTWRVERDGVIEGYIAIRKQNGQLHVKEFAVSDAVFEQNNAKVFFEMVLSDIIAQLDAERFLVEYPAPLADGFNAPTVEPRGSTMYRVILPDALPSAFAEKSGDVFPNLLHEQVESLRQPIRSHHVFWSTDGF